MQVSKSAYMPKLLIMKFVFKKVALVSVYFDSKLPKKVIRADLNKCSTDVLRILPPGRH